MEVFDLSDKTERVLLVGVQENDGDVPKNRFRSWQNLQKLQEQKL